MDNAQTQMASLLQILVDRVDQILPIAQQANAALSMAFVELPTISVGRDVSQALACVDLVRAMEEALEMGVQDLAMETETVMAALVRDPVMEMEMEMVMVTVTEAPVLDLDLDLDLVQVQVMARITDQVTDQVTARAMETVLALALVQAQDLSLVQVPEFCLMHLQEVSVEQASQSVQVWNAVVNSDTGKLSSPLKKICN
jgi:hypothetical protein